jgi:metal-responsive CopG/Arc/MetJ family transcriptional regulator
MKTAISLPDPLFRSADRAARRLHMSRSRFFVSAVSRYVHEVERSDVTERINAVYCRLDPQDASIAPAIATMQAASIPQDVRKTSRANGHH